MPSVLSTKILTPPQKNLLINAGLSLTEYKAIQIEILELPQERYKDHYPHAIITSQKAAELIKHFSIGKCYCVGDKTALSLKDDGFLVEAKANNAKDLAEAILQNYRNHSFTFFGSQQRRPELSEMLRESDIDLKEVFVYKTHLIPKQFNRSFDAVLCFSPSGVDSLFKVNASLDSNLICIGNTTATQAKKYSKRVYVSSKTSVESLIVKAVQLLRP
ncbi:uroporphyrinogen-III synthase [Psychroflexus gondwanensis]|uniref:uroporphyrinogen-III synthase n=1 Tax=Psychroflexus gondwanensis TaxID=251 RepID=UPI0011BF1FF4|nr:uroporphyrinogen-III synthase [Psychroflexus gondwanensis]TXE21171.1 uroporphyrinogen-III synthase [Psychroflexus gondwanensis]